ncbi:MAG: NAD(P)H-hydrate dehydratase [Planctomycetes bacterium]|nr:NAD(P)H-hydrate dehydratase [Planctomycetota bacterium]
MKPPFRLTKRARDSHKGDFGRVLVVAGSRRMPGAATLAALGALRGGAGLVTVATPECALPLIAPACPCALFEPLPATREGFVANAALEHLVEAARRADVVVLGPGLGTEEATQFTIRSFALELGKPLVLDADGLNAFAAEPDVLARRSSPTIMTPHPGELERLDGKPATADAKERLARAKAASARFRAIVCLKGAGTVVASASRTYVNRTGNPGMATGGSGDVLSGLLGALIVRFDDPFKAAALAVHMHGRAGDLAKRRRGETALIALDLVEHLGDALKAVEAPR